MLPVMRQILLSNTDIKYYTNGKENVPWVEGYSLSTGVVSKEADHLSLSTTRTGVESESWRAFVTDVPVDLTRIKTLEVSWESVGVDDGLGAYLIASTNKTGTVSAQNARLIVGGLFSVKTSTLDVSALSGLYYLRIHASSNSLDALTLLNVYRLRGKK